MRLTHLRAVETTSTRDSATGACVFPRSAAARFALDTRRSAPPFAAICGTLRAACTWPGWIASPGAGRITAPCARATPRQEEAWRVQGTVRSGCRDLPALIASLRLGTALSCQVLYRLRRSQPEPRGGSAPRVTAPAMTRCVIEARAVCRRTAEAASAESSNRGCRPRLQWNRSSQQRF